MRNYDYKFFRPVAFGPFAIGPLLGSVLLVHSQGPWLGSPYTSGMTVERSKSERTVLLALLIMGGLCFLLWIFLRQKITPLLILAGVTWVAAHLCVLAYNYKRKAPVPTRGGWLTYEKNPLGYRLLYIFMVFAGLFFLLAFLILNIFGTR
jgi:hypothetical protein